MNTCSLRTSLTVLISIETIGIEGSEIESILRSRLDPVGFEPTTFRSAKHYGGGASI